MAGIDRPTSGTVMVAGTALDGLSDSAMARWRARHIGYVFQSYNLIPVLTAAENVELPLLLTHLSRRERAEHVKTALRLVGLQDRMDHYPRQLSGGQEQRVGLARAIVADPTVILADEPTGNLDRDSAENIMTLFGRLHAELRKTIVMVTHDPRAAERAQAVRHLEKGVLESPS
jgi:putative ABC transport system ATP-binding protein